MKHNPVSMKSQGKYSPKIGVNNQAEIPVLVNKSDYLSQESSSSLKFVTGLPVPVFLACGENACVLVPYSASEGWNEFEKESFLLGLYIFGKSIIQLKNFVQTKKKQDILSYYYGMFFRSHEYLRWSDSRKMLIDRKCVLGEMFGTDDKLREFISRILPLVSKTSKDVVLKASKQFEEGKKTFEYFVNTLKPLVGMKSLVDAVGIGKVGKDLTCIMEPLKSKAKQGKAFSAYTTSDIVKHLNENRRQTKHSCKDIFRLAVWPRLERKGWHSETAQGGVVYLIPGIEDFNRKKLVKGNHYFDCVSDVLNKVASDPGLLENEGDNVSDERRNSTLQPQIPIFQGINGIRFTVIDTSLANGELHKRIKVKDLSADTFTSFNAFVVESDHDDIQLPSSEVQILEIGNKTQEMHIAIPQSHVPISDDTSSKFKRGLEHKLGTNEDDSEGVAPDIKRRRSCNQGETNNAVTSTTILQAIVALEVPNNVASNPSVIPFKPEPEKPSSCRANQDNNVKTIFSSDVSLALKNSLSGSIGYATPGVKPQQTSRVMHMFDLNLLPDCGFEPSMIEEETPMYNDASNTSQEATYKIIPESQRRSTRNRPPTTRSLEAIANGFLTVNTRRRGANGHV